MPDYTPLSLTRNPFNPAFVEPNDLIAIPVAAGRTGLDHLSAKVDEYEQKLAGLGASDLNRHFVCVTGPSKGGRSTFLKLLAAKLDARLGALNIDPASLYRYATHPETQLNAEEGPNATFKEILRGLLVDMMGNNGRGRFDRNDLQAVFSSVLRAKELDDISNAFVERMELSLAGLQQPMVLCFENLNSSGLYRYLRQTFLNIPCIMMVTSYSAGATGREFQAIHNGDRRSWWTDLDPVDCGEILALTEHNLNRARTPQPGILPFERDAIEGFFSGGIQRQPMGRLMHACFHSIELKAAQLQQNAAAPRTIKYEDMQEALKRR